MVKGNYKSQEAYMRNVRKKLKVIGDNVAELLDKKKGVDSPEKSPQKSLRKTNRQ